MVKVYTRGGDKGLTSLADGSRVSKADPRLGCYGHVDELNTLLGQVAVLNLQGSTLPPESRRALSQWLKAIQNDLFQLGSDLATPTDKRWPGQHIMDKQDVQAAEALIDFCDQSIPPLSQFVLPGGSALNASLHQARAVCRRAERSVAGQLQALDLNPESLRYLNRLSDLLFTLARWVIFQGGLSEQTWDKDQGLCKLEIG